MFIRQKKDQNGRKIGSPERVIVWAGDRENNRYNKPPHKKPCSIKDADFLCVLDTKIPYFVEIQLTEKERHYVTADEFDEHAQPLIIPGIDWQKDSQEKINKKVDEIVEWYHSIPRVNYNHNQKMRRKKIDLRVCPICGGKVFAIIEYYDVWYCEIDRNGNWKMDTPPNSEFKQPGVKNYECEDCHQGWICLDELKEEREGK